MGCRALQELDLVCNPHMSGHAAAAIAAAAWFMTPLPDLAAGVLVDAIPIDEDVALGRAGAAQAGYHLQSGCRPGRRCVDRDRRGTYLKIKNKIRRF